MSAGTALDRTERPRRRSDREPIVEVTDLTVVYGGRSNAHTAVTGLSFTIGRGETVAIVGESGSGKTTTANAVIGLLGTGATITAGTIRVAGTDVTHAAERVRRGLRGRTIGLVPQDPLAGLNPTMRNGRQIAEALILAKGARYRGVDADVVDLLESVGIDDPVLRARQYPHELSGGMRQRVLIAIALAGNPELIIADEPTSALDVTVQRRILDHLAGLVRERGVSLLIITHDLGVAADRADRVLVMQHGTLVEAGAPAQILVTPREPYTRQLIAAAPALGGDGEIAIRHTDVPTAPIVLDVRGVRKEFAVPHGRTAGGRRTFTAVDDVSLRAFAGQTLAIVGESGSGKTTTLRIALGLETPTAGSVTFDGEELTGRRWRELRPLRRRMQLVQQNPFASLDPRFTVFESVVEPLVSFRVGSAAERTARARELLDLVGLPASFLGRRPRELSGGQRQRVAIARALALGPELLFLDEPVSALDVSVQAQILDLLAELQDRLGVAYVLVSHDLSVVASVAHHVVVLQAGRVVEQGTAAQVFGSPHQDYTKELLDAVPGRSLAREGAGR